MNSDPRKMIAAIDRVAVPNAGDSSRREAPMKTTTSGKMNAVRNTTERLGLNVRQSDYIPAERCLAAKNSGRIRFAQLFLRNRVGRREWKLPTLKPLNLNLLLPPCCCHDLAVGRDDRTSALDGGTGSSFRIQP